MQKRLTEFTYIIYDELMRREKKIIINVTPIKLHANEIKGNIFISIEEKLFVDILLLIRMEKKYYRQQSYT